jgi:small acid-soluble spore protein D (minor alpha/beta-type SASP)
MTVPSEQNVKYENAQERSSGEVKQMTRNNNKVNVPEAKDALSNMKFEIARELGVNLKQGYNGDLTSRENGYVGGYMVKKMIEDYERQASGNMPQ